MLCDAYFSNTKNFFNVIYAKTHNKPEKILKVYIVYKLECYVKQNAHSFSKQNNIIMFFHLKKIAQN